MIGEDGIVIPAKVRERYSDLRKQGFSADAALVLVCQMIIVEARK